MLESGLKMFFMSSRTCLGLIGISIVSDLSRTWSLDSLNVLVGLDRVQLKMLFFPSFKAKPLIWRACSANG